MDVLIFGCAVQEDELYVFASVPVVGSCRKSEYTRPSPREGQDWTLDSSFLLWKFLLQHCLHNPDLGALTAIYIGRKVEQLGILSRACGVEQSPPHRQSATVVLDHPCQKQVVELGALGV